MEKEEKEPINGKGMTTFNFRAEVWWRVEHASSITVVYFSSHLCKPAHEILQVSWSASFLLLVQAQKHLPLLLQMKNKYLTGGRHKRTTIWMTFSSLKCNRMLKISDCTHCPQWKGQQRNQKPWPYSSSQVKNKKAFWFNYPCLKVS